MADRIPRLALATILAALVATSTLLSAAVDRCDNCLWARYWPVNQPASACVTPNVPCFPETDMLRNGTALGIAFSGGGTRSATMALGQMRGLQHIGVLKNVRYVSAVSGGSWAAVPYVYTKLSIDEFLGAYQEPASLDVQKVVNEPHGALGDAIVDSSLTAGSIREVLGDLSVPFTQKLGQQLLTTIRSGLDSRVRREASRLNKTYARLIGSRFIDPLVDVGTTSSGRLFSWNADTIAEIGRLTNGALGEDFVIVPDGRPFLIANGTLIAARPDYAYPILLPVEYTPLYVGVRPQLGSRFGGTYVSPWAYDATRIVDVNERDHLVRVERDPGRIFTLGDVVGSSGAAPQLQLVLGSFAPASFRTRVQQAAAVFPAFRHLSVHAPTAGRNVLTEEVGHGDGGFGDNLGLLPLLARGVRNIIVFNNSNTMDVENNNDFKSLFFPIGPPSGNGDKRFHVVFEAKRYAELLDGLEARKREGKSLFYCNAEPWPVLANEHFGIAADPSGVHVCWFYNSKAPAWEATLPEQLQRMVNGTYQMKQAGRFERFPWFSTFYQNATNVIRLTAAQVNLLSNLTAWIVTEESDELHQRLSLPQ
jgi:hypothetical protein